MDPTPLPKPSDCEVDPIPLPAPSDCESFYFLLDKYRIIIGQFEDEAVNRELHDMISEVANTPFSKISPELISDARKKLQIFAEMKFMEFYGVLPSGYISDVKYRVDKIIKERKGEKPVKGYFIYDSILTPDESVTAGLISKSGKSAFTLAHQIAYGWQPDIRRS